jgi:sugar/nucleoside kinase (ribokinase family)
MRVAVVGAWTSDGLARRIKRLLTEYNVDRDDLISVSHGRSGIFGAVIANGPLSAVVVWRER